MGEMVIVAYRPKPGREAELLDLIRGNRGHVRKLRELDLVTDRPALAMRNADGVIVEVFEWHEGAVEIAHDHPAVQAMWAEFAAVCDYVPLGSLPEAERLFAHFEPIDL